MLPSLLMGLQLAFAQLEPAEAVVALPCQPNIEAACWNRAPVLGRFAAPSEARTPVLEAALRLGWNEDSLLLRVDDLPRDTTIELSASPSPGETALRQLRTIRGENGILALPLSDLEAGFVLRMQLNLVQRREEGTHAYIWSPSGNGRNDIGATVLLAEEIAPGFDLEFSTAPDGTLHILAPGANRIELRHARTEYPRGSRVPSPWSITSRDELVVLPPDTGWHRLEARWTDSDGQLIDLQQYRLWVDAPTPTELSEFDVHPRPRWTEPISEAPFVLENDSRICVPESWLPAGRLMQEEIQRFSGIRTTIETSPDSPCTITMRSGSDHDALPEDAREMIAAAEGFGIIVQRETAMVLATDLRGAVYGALALADAIGPDGRSPGFRAADSPEMAQRVIFWNLNIRNTPDWSLEAAQNFIRRAVLRGRINLLVISPTDSLQYTSHPEIGHARALTPAQLGELIRTARELGVEVVPGLNSPGHADWLTRSHPELVEDVNSRLACTRHPDLRPLIEDLMTDLIDIFGPTRWMHIGRDESHWQSNRYFEDERCPRCAGTPRAILFADDLAWQIDWLLSREIRPMIWSDMILEEWNGSRDGVHHALAELTDTQRDALMVMAWSPLGAPIRNLAETGIDTMRVHTGYLDWKRDGLVEQMPQLSGEGLGLWTGVPWRAVGPSTGTRPLHYYWSSVILAGTTAWRPELGETTIVRSLVHTAHLPAFRPGLEHIVHEGTRALSLRGEPAGGEWAEITWPGRLRLEGIRFGRADPRLASSDTSIIIPIDRPVAGISLLHATLPTHAATQEILRGQRNGNEEPTAEIVFHFSDGSEAVESLRYGRNTYRPDGDLRSRTLWSTAGTWSPTMPSDCCEASERPDRHLYRIDLRSPHPERSVDHVEIRTTREGVTVLVAGASSLEHP